MEYPSAQRILDSRVNEFKICIRLLLDNRHTLPALILLYSGIDALASLLRSEKEPDTTGAYFKKWTADYMVSPSGMEALPEDLWGARCGLLHTHAASSKVAREGKARPLHYYRCHSPSPEGQQDLQKKLQTLRAAGKLPVDVDAIYAAFDHGLDSFLQHVQRDPQLAKRVHHHASLLFGSWTYVP